METFDVYLKNRLTEIDLTISQLIQRDTFSMYDLLTLTCSINELEIMKSIRVDANMEIDARIQSLLKTAYETIRSDMYLQTEAELLDQTMTGMSAEMVLSAGETDVSEQSFAEAENDLELSVQRLDCFIAHSFGLALFEQYLDVNQAETFKYSYEQFMQSFILNAETDFAATKNLGLDEVDMTLDVDAMNIFYLLTTGCRASAYLSAAPVDEYVLKKILHDLNVRMTLNAVCSTALSKYIDPEFLMFLTVNMSDVLISSIFPANSETIMSCEASMGLYRYRRLEEMDDLTLADLDDSTLYDLDYVIIAE